MPIEWEEPFGLVMTEALASGTPVVALRRGSVPEILRHGKTAFIANDLAEMASLVDRAEELDPARLRLEAETRFSIEQMVDGYLEAYETMIGREQRDAVLRRRLSRRFSGARHQEARRSVSAGSNRAARGGTRSGGGRVSANPFAEHSTLIRENVLMRESQD